MSEKERLLHLFAQNIGMDLRAGSSPRLRNGQPVQRQTHGQALGLAYFGPEFFFPNAVLAFLELYVQEHLFILLK